MTVTEHTISGFSSILRRVARRLWAPLFAGVLVLSLTSCAGRPASSTGPGPGSSRVTPSSESTIAPSGYHTIFADEFDGDALDTATWNTELTWGTKPESELEQYSADAMKVANGLLTITASRTPGMDRPYRSGVIASFGKFDFTYGYVEMRAKMPPGAGMWPAFWMLCRNEDLHREIDVTELLGRLPGRSYMTLHYREGSEQKNFHTFYEGGDLTKDFHVYAVNWMPGKVEWYLDGVKRYEVSDSHVPKDPMYLIANLAIGGRWSGAPDEQTVFPAEMQIDYIRVFQAD